MNNLFNFITFGFCLGMAISSFINQNWGLGAIQALLACVNIPFMVISQ